MKRFSTFHKSSESGYVLIVIISMLSILMVIGVSFAGFAYYGLQRTASVRDSTQAYFAAKAGIAEAINTAAKEGKFQGELETILTPMDESTTTSNQVSAKIQWSPLSTQIPIQTSGTVIEIQSRGLVQLGERTKGERLLYAIVGIQNQKIYYLTDLPVSQSDVKESK